MEPHRTEDPRLEKIRKKDPIIATYTARDLVAAPQTVFETYSEHALTHMSLGDTSDYLDRLLKWLLVNQGCVVGAVVGPIGYGKTSTAIYLWWACEQEKLIAVPPFKWYSLEELIEATFGWVRYKLERSAPLLIESLDAIRARFKKKSIECLAAELRVREEDLRSLNENGQLNLRFNAEDVLAFWEAVTKLLREAGFKGLVVFTDELQDTLAAYPTRDKFMSDVFNLADGLIRHDGNYGMMFLMPTATEALIRNVRPDIIQRMEVRNLFIRAEAAYGRHFPSELWKKYACLYGFEAEQSKILPRETLDAIGQISSRKDLGAGPRTVIDALVQAVNHYDVSRRPYSPIDLIDDYLGQRIAFQEGGKVVLAVTEALAAQYVAGNPNRVAAIKLMAAYPKGCSDEVARKYDLAVAVEDLARQLYGEYLHRFDEGYSLRKLAEIPPPPEPVFLLRVRDFVNRFAEDSRHAELAGRAFTEQILVKKLLEPKLGKSLVGWTGSGESQFDGAFSARYPNRRLSLSVVTEQENLGTSRAVDGIGMWIGLDWHCGLESSGSVKRVADNKAVIRLNLLRRPALPLNIPQLVDTGFPPAKMSPMFMLALADYLEQNRQNIPNDEQAGPMLVLISRLLDCSVELLLGNGIWASSDWPLQRVGLDLLKDLFNQICETLYPDYVTFVTVAGWERNIGFYAGALKDARLTLAMIRGRDPFEAPKAEIAGLFNQTILSFKTMAETLTSIMNVEEWEGRDRGRIRFVYHPLELAILDALRASPDTTGGGGVPTLFDQDVFGLASSLGYLQIETAKALELLKLRKHVTYNQHSRRIEEVRESLEERKNDLCRKLEELKSHVARMSKIPLFDAEYYEESIPQLVRQVQQADNVMECEDIQQKINEQFKRINGFIQVTVGGLRAELNALIGRAEAAINSGLPRELAEPIQGVVPWVTDISNCQGLLTTKHNKVLADSRSMVGQARAALASPSQQNPIEMCLAVYQRCMEFREKQKGVDEEKAAASSYMAAYRSWKALLAETGRVYTYARNALDNYGNASFVQQLDSIFADVHGSFVSRKLEALLDHENFKLEIDQVTVGIDSWVRERRQAFLKLKESYQGALAGSFQIEQYVLRTNFDAFDPAGSFVKLQSEILEKIQERMAAIEVQVKRNANDVLYSTRILGNSASEASALIEVTVEKVGLVTAKASTETIRDFLRFELLAEEVAAINGSMKEIEAALRGISPKRDASHDELNLMQLLDDPRGTDLRDLIMRLVEANPDNFSLDVLTPQIQSLFQKNQVTVRIAKR